MKLSIVATNRCQVPEIVMPVGACQMAERASEWGHDVRLIDLMFRGNPRRSLRQHLRDHQPDCVGMSIRNVDNGDMCDPVSYCDDLAALADSVRAAVDGPLIIGGGAVSVMPEEFLRLTDADWAVVGEGEHAFKQCLDAYADRDDPAKLPGVATLRDGGVVVNAPAHDWTLAGPVAPEYSRWVDVGRYYRQGAAAPIQTKRGCPRRCAYCTYPQLEGRSHRTASPRRVADAVERLAGRGAKEVEFVDNVFNDPPEHALAICEELTQRNLQIRLRTADLSPRALDGTLLEAMESAGFTGFGLTAESASQEVLKGLRKDYGVDQLQAAAEAVRGQDMPCMWIYMLGGPGETPQTVRQTLDFAESQLRSCDAAVFFPGIRIFPNTHIETLAREEGLLPDRKTSLLEPQFYLSPEVERDWLIQEVQDRARRVPGFLPPASRTASFLPLIYRLTTWMGLEPPLWQHTSAFRRMLAPFGF